MKLTFLGTGNAFVPRRYWGGILVNDTILLDAGPSTLANLKRLSLEPARIRHVFLSHFHGDHLFGLPFLLLEYHFLSRTREPLAIIGPPGVAERVEELMALAYPDLVEKGWPRPMHFVEARPGEPQEIDGLTFSALKMAHGNGYLTAFGYRLHLDDGILAYSGDTSMTDALYTLIDGTRAVILEADSAEESAVHLGRRALRVLLHHAAHGAVFLNHLDTPDAEPWRDFPVIVPEDLTTYTVDDTVIRA